MLFVTVTKYDNVQHTLEVTHPHTYSLDGIGDDTAVTLGWMAMS
jgi:hypothetical protein